MESLYLLPLQTTNLEVLSAAWGRVLTTDPGPCGLENPPALFSEQQTHGKLESPFRQKPVPPAIPSQELRYLPSRVHVSTSCS